MEQNELLNATNALKSNGVILLPTDTCWAIACDATRPDAVEKLLAYKTHANINPSVLLLLDQENRLLSYFQSIPDSAWTLFEYAERPLTLILDNAVHLHKDLISEDGSMAVRISRKTLCKELIRKLHKPLAVLTLQKGAKHLMNYRDIPEAIFSNVDYIVNSQQNESLEQTNESIIRLKENGSIQILKN